MNKTILIAGGASIASLAVGGAAGYFIARRNFEEELEVRITEEVEKTKKYFSVRLMQAEQGKPDSPGDIPRRPREGGEDQELQLEGEDSDDEDDLSEEDTRALGRRRGQPEPSLVDYRQYSKKPDETGTIVEKNIFSDSAPEPPKRPALPPKDPASGRFVKRDGPAKNPEPTPYLINEDVFMANEDEHDMMNYLYFPEEKILIDIEDDNAAVDIGIVGEVNLTLFPPDDEDGNSSIYVCNEGMGRVIEIRKMQQSLTSFVNLAETGVDEEADMGDFALENI